MKKIQGQARLAVFWVLENPDDESAMKSLVTALDEQFTIPGVLTLDHGPRALAVDWEGPKKAFNYGMVMTFDSFESGRAWVPHPIHQKLVQTIMHLGSTASDFHAFWIGD